MAFLLPFFVLLFTYLALSGSIRLPNLIIGTLISISILALLRPRRPPVNWSRIPSAFLALTRYILLLIKNTIVSALQVSKIVFHPGLPIKPGIIKIPPECESELGQALGSFAISITPGELLIEMGKDGTLYVHTLDVEQTEQLALKSQELRQNLMKKIFD